ncbi:MAG: 4-deoxy-4-formamido-L-arabinose-phosphoundecaprenol deformylase, partial [Acidobacteriota bacterium]|nr:4-deoxy-4-formamido-L-arabinose-phosphoundecaprenol deformylase [Acidobacteriota bacterium]
FPSAGGRPFRTLEIPSTLPTLDETLGWPELPTDAAQREFYRGAVAGAQLQTTVHTVHAEVEGRSKRRLFEAILDGWIGDGVHFDTLGEIARDVLTRRERIPVRELTRITLPGRGGTVASGWPGN